MVLRWFCKTLEHRGAEVQQVNTNLQQPHNLRKNISDCEIAITRALGMSCLRNCCSWIYSTFTLALLVCIVHRSMTSYSPPGPLCVISIFSSVIAFGERFRSGVSNDEQVMHHCVWRGWHDSAICSSENERWEMKSAEWLKPHESLQTDFLKENELYWNE